MTNAPETPLSLYLLLDPAVLANPYPLYRRLRTEDPVHWDPYLYAWIVTRYEDIVTVLTHFSAERTPSPEFFDRLGASHVGPIAKIMVKQMLFLDPPSHTRVRKLATPAFVPTRISALRDHIDRIATRLIDDVIARGSGQMELMSDFAEPLPAIVTAEMLGVPVEDHRVLKEWSAVFAGMLGNFQHNPDQLEDVLPVVEKLTTYFQDAILACRRHPREGLVQALMASEVDGDRLTDEEIVANCIITMVGGQETTTNLIGNGTLTLLRNPDQLAELRSDCEIMPAAVEELLRYESPTQHTARLAPEATVLGEKEIGKGQAVIAVMAAGNRDPQRFRDPDRLDLGRPDNRHLAFGWAAHFCFGAPLARLEAQVAFEVLLRRFKSLELTDDALLWRANLALRGLQALPLKYEVKA